MSKYKLVSFLVIGLFLRGYAYGQPDKLTVDADGEVGIGVSSPISNLHIYDDGRSYLYLDSGDDASQVAINMVTEGTPDGEAVKLQPNLKAWHIVAKGAQYLNVNVRHSLLFGYWDGTTYTKSLVLDESGDIGIGTNKPERTLHVAGQGIRIEPSSLPGDPDKGDVAFDSSDDTLKWYDGTSWVSSGGGGGGCYVSYSGACISGFTNMGSAGTYGGCAIGSTRVFFSPPGGVCDPSHTRWVAGTAVVCCQ